jgi:hypothetical protein
MVPDLLQASLFPNLDHNFASWTTPLSFFRAYQDTGTPSEDLNLHSKVAGSEMEPIFQHSDVTALQKDDGPILAHETLF